MRIDVKDLTKTFGPASVLHDINLSITEREFLGLLGPSGSGKTTLLRILAGLERPDSGTVTLDGKESSALAFEERRIGFVFQHYALFNHMTVFDNVAFGLKVRPRAKRPDHRAIAERVHALLRLVHLERFADRFPMHLSGGQRQRVALARTLATDPRVLLLDEPFGALDTKVRVELRRSLREIHDSTGLTTIFVTHDQEEALSLADRVAVMRDGIIEQIGPPADIYEKPRTPFVFDFLGRTNAFECDIEHGKAQLGDKELPVGPNIADGPGIAFVRPHDVVLDLKGGPDHAADATLAGNGSVRFISVLGQQASLEVLYQGHLISVVMPRERLDELKLSENEPCRIRLRLPSIYARHDAERQTQFNAVSARPHA